MVLLKKFQNDYWQDTLVFIIITLVSRWIQKNKIFEPPNETYGTMRLFLLCWRAKFWTVSGWNSGEPLQSGRRRCKSGKTDESLRQKDRVVSVIFCDHTNCCLLIQSQMFSFGSFLFYRERRRLQGGSIWGECCGSEKNRIETGGCISGYVVGGQFAGGVRRRAGLNTGRGR